MDPFQFTAYALLTFGPWAIVAFRDGDYRGSTAVLNVLAFICAATIILIPLGALLWFIAMCLAFSDKRKPKWMRDEEKEHEVRVETRKSLEELIKEEEEKAGV